MAATRLTGCLIAMLLGLVCLPAGADLYFVQTNHLGAPIAMTDVSSQVVWRATYEPFGKATVTKTPSAMTPNPPDLHIRLPGQYFDAETGLHYNFFRDYDPAIGRYVESDPVGLAGGLNPYVYAGGNPVRFIDPDGLDIMVIENGPTEGNPIGHTATAITASGVYSPGNSTPPGSSVADYIRREAGRRDTKIYIIPTTPAQDAAALMELRGIGNRPLGKFTDNCASDANRALDAAGIPDNFWPRNLPGKAGARAASQGAPLYEVPKGGIFPIPGKAMPFEPR